MVLELEAFGYRVRIDPRRGGAVLSAQWTPSDRPTVPLLEPLDDASAGFPAGCFAMLPFANRIDRGRFVFDGRACGLPVNRPAEDMAIHGFSRDNPWEIVRKSPDSILLSQQFRADGNPYRYHAEQEIRLSAEGIRILLSIRNEAARAMPFGMGLHPWFPKTGQATLAFGAAGAFGRDARGLPVAPPAPVDYFTPNGPTRLSSVPWFDSCFAGWHSRAARIAWPEHGTGLTLTAEGALDHLHVYVPDDLPVFCAEPVSHVPDTINRPELGTDGAMTVLRPAETMSGAMTLAATALDIIRPDQTMHEVRK